MAPPLSSSPAPAARRSPRARAPGVDGHDEPPAGAPLPLGAVLDFMRLLWAVDHGLQSVSKRTEARHGVTGPQRVSIRVLGRHPNLAAGELARILHLHPSTLTGIVRRLVARKLVERVVDRRDRRRVLLRLTARGRALDRLEPGTAEAAAERVLARLGRRSLLAATKVLQTLAEELARDV